MEESTVKNTPLKNPKRLRSSSGVNDIGIKEKSEQIITNGTGNASDNCEQDNDEEMSQATGIAKIGKKTKGETPKSPQKSMKKGVKEFGTKTVEDPFSGFGSDEISSDTQKKINFLNFIDEFQSNAGASTSGAVTEATVADDDNTEEDRDMTVDTAAATSDDTDSDQMEIDSKAGDQNKESDVDVESVKSDHKEKGVGVSAKVEYCGACSAEVDDAEEGICCDGVCERWFHLKCSGLSQAEYNELSLDENAKWACPKCSGKPPTILSAEPKTPKISVRKDLQKTPGPSVAKRKSIMKDAAAKTPKIDISNPTFLKPFDFGWKRELVYRTSNEAATNKRNGDIYYYTPKGKKLRSLREISEHLIGSELTIDNFTFWKEPIGVDDPEKEVIRDAKYKLQSKDGTASPSLVSKKAATTPKISKVLKTTPKLTATITLPVHQDSSTPKASLAVTPRVMLKGKASPTVTPKVKIAPSKTVTPKPVISKGERRDLSIHKTLLLAEKARKRSSLRSARYTSRYSDCETNENNKRISKEIEQKKKNKFRRYGLLANRRTSNSSPDSEDSNDFEETNPPYRPPKRNKKRSKRSRPHKKNAKLAPTPQPEQKVSIKVAPFVRESTSPLNPSATESLPLPSHPYLSEPDQSFPPSLDLSRNRPSPPELQFRPSNPSNYGCQKSSSMLSGPAFVEKAFIPNVSLYQPQKSTSESYLDPFVASTNSLVGNFEFVSISSSQTAGQSTPPESSLTLLPPPSPTNSVHIIDVIQINDDDDYNNDGRKSPPDLRSNSPGGDMPSMNTSPPHLYLETEPPIAPIQAEERKKKVASDDEMEIGMLPPTWDPVPKKEKTLGVCSINCLPAMGTIPTLQCVSCLCLYHLQCVGLEEASLQPIHNYKCKNCQLEKNKPAPITPTNGTKPTLPPPPLTPISTLTNTSSVNSPLSAPPKLQRINDVRQATSRANNIMISKSTSIVGGVTTWLPPSSSIQLRPAPPPSQNLVKFSPVQKALPPASTPTADPSSTQPVQALVTVAGTRYIVVPKHNVLSVGQPTTSSTQVSESSSVQTTTTASDPNSAMTASISQNFSTVPHILPKGQTSPSALIVSPPKGMTAFQNPQGPPGVLLVPYINNPTSPNQLDGQQPQYVLVNNTSGIPSGNFIFGNIPQSRQLILPTVPTCQPSEPSADPTGAAKRALESAEESPTAKRLKQDAGPSPFMKNFMQNFSYMRSSLLHAFQYLKVQELLRASRVNHLWNDLALHKSLWDTVKMKNSQVKDWEGFAATLKRTRTRHLDLRKILVPGKDETEAVKNMWADCVKALAKVDSLVKIEFCRCTSSLVQQIAQACPQLEYISAVFIKDVEFDFIDLEKCTNLTELKLKSQSGIEIKNIKTLPTLKQLKNLSLLTIKNMNEVLEAVGELTQLESLELGEMTKIDKEVVTKALSPLTKLKRLRLEKGQNECPTVAILTKISELPNLNQLELINFDIKFGFDDALALCTNIKTLLIIPTYVTQSATTNHLVIEGVGKLYKTLNHFVWGLTLELLRVTDLFIDQWEQNQNSGTRSPTSQPPPKKPGAHDSIPILKPTSKDGKSPKEGVAVTQVDVLQLPKLHKVLTSVLPNTKIIILKVPFNATWRQTINSNSN